MMPRAFAKISTSVASENFESIALVQEASSASKTRRLLFGISVTTRRTDLIHRIRGSSFRTDGTEKPDLGIGPVSFHRSFGNAQCLCDFCIGQSDEKSQFNHHRRVRVVDGETIDQLVDLQQALVAFRAGDFQLLPVNALLAAPVA